MAHISFLVGVSFSLNKYPGVELLNHMVILFLISWGISILFSTVSAPIYIPTNNALGFPLFHILANTCIICFLFNDSHSNKQKTISLWFWFTFPWWVVMLSIFSCAHQLSDTFFVKVSIQVLCPFFNQVVWVGFFFCFFFLMLSCLSSLFILDINPLSYMSFANIFCHSVGSLFNLLIVFFAVQKRDVVLCLYFCFFLPSLKRYAPAPKYKTNVEECTTNVFF